MMGADSLHGANPDLAACISVFVVFSLGAFLTFLPFTFGEGVLRRPGLDRSPLTWGRDPLQALAFTTLAMLGIALGAWFHISGSGDVGFWMVASLWCLFAGLVFGQIIGYASWWLWRYREREFTKSE